MPLSYKGVAIQAITDLIRISRGFPPIFSQKLAYKLHYFKIKILL